MLFVHEQFDFVELKRVDSPQGRRYSTPTGAVYPSVTTVIGAMSDKEGLKKWRERLGEAEANKVGAAAAKRGSIMHKMCEEYLLNQPVSPDPSPLNLQRAMFDSIKPILDKRVTKVYGIEFPVYSDRLKTAGTVDFFCEFDGKSTVLDFKTSTREKREEWIRSYFIQATIYAMCLYEIYGIRVEQIAIMIAVEHDMPQLFIKDPTEFVSEAVKMFNDYHKGIRVND